MITEKFDHSLFSVLRTLRCRHSDSYIISNSNKVRVDANERIAGEPFPTLNAFEQAVQDHPQIVECFSMSGESDYLIQLIVPSITEYERLLKTVLAHLPGVGSINSRFVLNRVKFTTNVPL